MAAATVATAATAAATAGAAVKTKADTPEATCTLAECPKCSHKVDDFLVDTNCTFRMCSNLDCTWPFDSDNMSQHFKYDHSIPSIRKRSKKRKSVYTKEDRKHKKPSGSVSSNRSVRFGSASARPNLPPSQTAATGATNANSRAAPPLVGLNAGNASGQLSDWLDSFCSGSASAGHHMVKSAATASVPNSAVSSTGLLLTQGKYNQQQQQRNSSSCGGEASGAARATNPCVLGTHNQPSYNSSDASCASGDVAENRSEQTPEWLDELLSSVTAPQISNNLTTPPASSNAMFASSSSPPNGVDDSLLFNANVADILAAFNSSSSSSSTAAASEDAVIPRTSRQPSPTSSNSESGADDIDNHSPLTPSELAMLIGNDKEITRMLSQTAAATSSESFDPLAVLLPQAGSAPAPSAVTAITSQDGAAAAASAPLDLSQLYWPQSDDSPSLTTAAAQVPFDFSDLLHAPTPTPSATAASLPPSQAETQSAPAGSNAMSSMDTSSIIEKLFGSFSSSSATTTSSS